jgi:hypothetical protein
MNDSESPSNSEALDGEHDSEGTRRGCTSHILSDDRIVIPWKRNPGWHPNDQFPQAPEHEHIRKVVDILGEAKMSCCIVKEHALNHYGAKRVPFVWKCNILVYQNAHFVIGLAYLRPKR